MKQALIEKNIGKDVYSIYDGAEKKEAVALLLNAHIDRFIAKIESGYRKSGTTL